MSITVRIEGIDKLKRKFGNATSSALIKRLMLRSAVHLVGWVKEKRLTGPRPKYLGVVTGNLRASIEPKRTQKRGNTYIGGYGTKVKYARKHELGEGVPARPFMKPAIQNRQNRKDIMFIFKTGVQEALNRG